MSNIQGETGHSMYENSSSYYDLPINPRLLNDYNYFKNNFIQRYRNCHSV